MALRGFRFVLCGCQVDDGILALQRRRERGAVLERGDDDADPCRQQALSAGALVVVVDGRHGSDLMRKARRQLRELAADEARGTRDQDA
jgi:hypothetical protein